MVNTDEHNQKVPTGGNVEGCLKVESQVLGCPIASKDSIFGGIFAQSSVNTRQICILLETSVLLNEFILAKRGVTNICILDT